MNDRPLKTVLARLRKANAAFARKHPGDPADRQPVHTVYGGAQLFQADSARKLGDLALRALREYGPDPAALAEALGLPRELGERVYPRVVAKLEREPVEDYRIDFEDGYGNRPDAEEDKDRPQPGGHDPVVRGRVRPEGGHLVEE